MASIRSVHVENCTKNLCIPPAKLAGIKRHDWCELARVVFAGDPINIAAPEQLQMIAIATTG
jgi:hypothetical protein